MAWRRLAGSQPPTAAALNDLAEMAERRISTADGKGLRQWPGGIVPEAEASPFIDAETVGEGEEGGLYAWREIYRDAATDAWTVLPGGRSGTTTEAPAIERNANADVAEGTRIRLELDPSEESYAFDAPDGSAPPRGGWVRYEVDYADLIAGDTGGGSTTEVLVVTLPAGTFLLAASLHAEEAFAGGGITAVPLQLLRCLQGTWGSTGVPGEPQVLVDYIEAHVLDASKSLQLLNPNAAGFGSERYGITEVYVEGTLTGSLSALNAGTLAVWLHLSYPADLSPLAAGGGTPGPAGAAGPAGADGADGAGLDAAGRAYLATRSIMGI